MNRATETAEQTRSRLERALAFEVAHGFPVSYYDEGIAAGQSHAVALRTGSAAYDAQSEADDFRICRAEAAMR